MKTYMPLDGFRWSCDSDSALCDIPQTNVLGQAGGVEMFIIFACVNPVRTASTGTFMLGAILIY